MNTVLSISFTIVQVAFLGASLLCASAAADGLELPETMVPHDHFAAVNTRSMQRQIARATPHEVAAETSLATVSETEAIQKPVKTHSPAKKLSALPAVSPVSALNRKSLLAKNPYGDISDKRGLWPYKPGQKYERTNERGSGLFGGLFGG